MAREFEVVQSTTLEPVFDADSGIVAKPWRLDAAVDSPIHKMMSRVGGFPPALARYFIVAYSRQGDVVLDPFCGKGTALHEAMRLGRNVGGSDIAPDAVIVSRAKCRPVTVAAVANYIQAINSGTIRSSDGVPADVKLFFQPTTFLQLLSVRAQLLRDMDRSRTRDVATFACGALLGILHGHSRHAISLPCNQAFAMSPNYVRKYVNAHGLKRPKLDVKDVLLERCLALLPSARTDVKSWVEEAPAQTSPAQLVKRLGAASLIITSPPYLNRQTYIKDSWLRTWFLARKRADVAAHSLETGNVVSFVQGMVECISAMAHALTPGGRIVLVCGRAKITIGGRDESVRIGELCLYAAKQIPNARLRVERIIVDKKLMRRGSYFAVHHGRANDGNGSVGPRFGEEEIIVLRKSAAVSRQR